MDAFEEAETQQGAENKPAESPFKHIGELDEGIKAGIWPSASSLPGVRRPGEWQKGKPIRFSDGPSARAPADSQSRQDQHLHAHTPPSPPQGEENGILRHTHGRADTDRPAPMRRTASQQSNGSSPHRSLRSNCHYHKVKFADTGESGCEPIILIPECSLQSNEVRRRLQAQDLGVVSDQEARLRKALHFTDQSLDHEMAYHFGSPRSKVAGGQGLPEELEHRLRQLVGADLLRERACFRLLDGEAPDEAEEERHSRSLFPTASPAGRRAASRSLSRPGSARSTSRPRDSASKRSTGESFSARLEATAEAPIEAEENGSN